MAHLKLTLDEEFEDPFDLIAIHCSEEDYKMAYLLNRHANMKFKRSKTDLDFTRRKELVFFTIYDFEDVRNHVNYYLIANKSHLVERQNKGQGNELISLFSNKMETHYLLPELKKIDYFIKIEHENGVFPLKKLVSAINEIKQVVTAYSIDVETVRSKNNLIFD